MSSTDRLAHALYSSHPTPTSGDIAPPEIAPFSDSEALGIAAPPPPVGPAGFLPGASTELPDARTPKSKTYANPDGSRTTDFFSAPAHVDDGSGHLVDVDSTLHGTPGGWESGPGIVANRIDSDLSSGWVTTTSAGHFVRLRPDAISPTAPTQSGPATISYPGVFTGTEFVLDALTTGVKADFVVTDSAVMRGAYSYLLQSDLTPVTAPDGSIEFRDEDGQAAFSIPKALAYDADANPEELPHTHKHPDKDDDPGTHKHPPKKDDPTLGVGDVVMTFSGNPGAYTITATPDPEWISDANRVFPVTIDPAFNWFVRADTFVSSSSPNANYWDFWSTVIPGTGGVKTPVRRIGKHPTYGENKTLIHLTPDDAVPAQLSQITDAKLTTYTLYDPNPGAHPWWTLATSDWNPYEATWNHQPAYAPDPPWKGYFDERDGAWMSSRSPQLTEAVRNWLTGAWQSRGFAISGGDAEYKLIASHFDPDPGKRPRLSVTYNSPPSVAMGTYPPDGTVTETETPDFTHSAASDPDGNTVSYQIRVSTSPDLKSGQVVSSVWSDVPNRVWRPPPGVLVDDTTYYWGVFTSDGSAVSPSDVLRPAPPGWVRSLRIDSKRSGARAGYSVQSYPIGSRANFEVNAESGALRAVVPGPSLGTATSPFSSALSYDSTITKKTGLTGAYYSPLDSGDPFARDNFIMERSDPMVAFSWGDKAFTQDINEDSFAVRFTGYIDIPDPGPNRSVWLGAYHDDGVKIFIGNAGAPDANHIIVDDTALSFTSRYSWSGFNDYMAPGRYPIVIEYFQDPACSVIPEPSTLRCSDNSGIQLVWRSSPPPSNWMDPDWLSASVVPGSNLVPETSRLPEHWSLDLPTGASIGPRRLEVKASNDVVIHSAGSINYTFTYKDGTYVAPQELHGAHLARAGDGTWSLGTDDGALSYFDAAGAMTSAYSPTDAIAREAPFQVIYSTDRLGPRIEEIRDLAGALRDRGGHWVNPDRAVRFEYGSDSPSATFPGRLVAIHYWDGTETRITYSPNGAIAEIENPGSIKTGFSYSSAGLITSGRSAASFDSGEIYSTDIAWQESPDSDVANAAVSKVIAPGPESGLPRPEVTYRVASPDPRPVEAAKWREIVDPTGLVTLIGFDAANRATYVRDSAGVASSTEYDAASRVTRTTGPEGRVTRFEYDGSGNLAKTIGPKSDPVTGAPVVSQSFYDEAISGLYTTFYNNKELSGANGGPAVIKTTTGLDASTNWGNNSPVPGKVGVDDFSARFVGELEIPEAGAYQFIANSDDGVRVYLGGTKAIEDWTEHAPRDIESLVYDLPKGRVPIVVEYFEAKGGASLKLDYRIVGWARTTVPSWWYKPNYGLMTSAQGPDGTKAFASYGTDPVDRLIRGAAKSTRGPDGETTWVRSSAKYIDHGRISESTRQPGDEAAEQVTSYSYWALTDSASPPAQCGGDSALQGGLPKSTTYPSGRAGESGLYDGSGRIISAHLEGAPESSACVSYDARSRARHVSPPIPTANPPSVVRARPVTYTYNSDDELVDSDDGAGGRVSASFDRLGRQLTHSDAHGGVTTFGYDLAGRQISSSGPAGTKTAALDGSGRMASLNWSLDGSQVAGVNYSYDFAGRTSSVTRANGTATNYRYSPSSELVSITHSHLAGAKFSGHLYDRDSFGRITADFSEAGDKKYSYDEAGRLDTVDEGPTRSSYLFDTHTNRRELTTKNAPYRQGQSGREVTSGGPSGVFRFGGSQALVAGSPGDSPSDARLIYGTDSWENYIAEVDVTGAGVGIDAGIDVRWNGGGATRYAVAIRGGDTALMKVTSGNFPVVASSARPHSPSVTYHLAVEVDGARVKVTEDGTELFSWTDPDGADSTTYAKSPRSHGGAGLSAYLKGARFDNFSVTTSGGDVLARDDFSPRTIEGDWHPDGTRYTQSRPNAHEVAGLVLTGSDTGGDFAVSGEFAFGPGPVDGGLRIKRNPANGDAYTIAIRDGDIVLFDSNGSTLGSKPIAHVAWATYSIRVEVTGASIRVFEDAALVIDATDTSSPLGHGEVAPYSWASPTSVSNLAITTGPPVSSTTYGYNATDQMTAAGQCSDSSCLDYDYRGNTVITGDTTLVFDTSNRVVHSESTPQPGLVGPGPIATNADGSLVVFASNRDGNDEIYLMGTSGGPATRLTSNPASDMNPTFTPDGARIFFASNRDGDYEIYSMASDGTDQVRVTNSPGDDNYPDISPDNTALAFSSTRDSNAEIYISDLNGANPTRMTNSPESEGFGAFGRGPNANKLAFTTNSSPSLFQIGVLDLDTNVTTMLTSTGSNAHPSWRPDGGRIVFTSYRDMGNAEIYSMAPDGTDQLRLTNNVADDVGPTYRFDSSILFISSASGALEIYSMGQDGSAITRLTSGAMVVSIARVGPGVVGSRVIVDYSYDALGRLKSMTSVQGLVSEVLNFGYSGPSDTYSYVARGSEAFYFVFSGPTGVIATATKSGGPISLRYNYYNGRGDTEAVGDSAGVITNAASYSEYGEARPANSAPPEFGFLGAFGRAMNPLTGFIHMGARLYDPKIGRFLSRDPITGGSANDYEYSGGDPINRMDPSGLYECDDYDQSCWCDVGSGSPFNGAPPGIDCGSYDPTPLPFEVGTESVPGFRYVPTAGRGGIEWADLGGLWVPRGIGYGRARGQFDYGDIGTDLLTTTPYWGKIGCAFKSNGRGAAAGIGCSGGWALDIISTGLSYAGGLTIWLLQAGTVGAANWAGQMSVAWI